MTVEQRPLDPRAVRSREAALAAARALLQEEGPAAVTHQRVAGRAGVGRATVYRHWPQPEQLLRDAMAGVGLPFLTDFQSDLPGWLLAQMRRLGDELALPVVTQVTATTLQRALWDPATREQLDEWQQTITDRLQQAVETAASGGEVDAPEALPDPADVAALLIGPMLYRILLQDRPVSDQLLQHALAAALRATAREDR